MSENRVRNFCFTWNNYTLEVEKYLQGLKTEYLCYGREVGEQGTPHLQGYLVFKNPRKMASAIKLLKGAHVSIAQGTSHENITYCSKDKDFFEQGDRPLGQGKRTDIDTIKILAKKGASNLEIAESSSSLQSFKFGLILKQVYAPKRNWPVNVKWYYGESGTGKTRAAAEEMPDAYWHDTGKWFCGYDCHENVIFDDLRPKTFTFQYLLRLLDRYPMTVETKGASVQWVPRNVIITTTLHPQFFCGSEESKQLIRRINLIKLFLNEDTNGSQEENSNTQTETPSEENKETSQNEQETSDVEF